MSDGGERKPEKGKRWEEEQNQLKGQKTWCEGKIWIDQHGCLVINDVDLAEALAPIYKKYGSICVIFNDPDGDGNKMNSLCSC